MKVAIIGTGISGMGVAWALTKAWGKNSPNSLTMFEAANYVGGHTNTVYIDPSKIKEALNVTVDAPIPVDTGFIVYNNGNYPNLIRFFDELGVDTIASDMSFSVSTKEVEWGSDGLPGLFAQRLNAFSPRFLRFVWDMFRFNSEVLEVLNNPEFNNMTLGHYCKLRGYSKAFLEWYLLPMTGAIWSTPQAEMLDFPIQSMITFMHNHKLLQINNRWIWRTVQNGSIEYVKRLISFVGKENILLNTKVKSIKRNNGKITIIDSKGVQYGNFDKVVFCCHGDTALEILGAEATAAEREALSGFKYKENIAVLHSDESFMPRSRSAWTSWNVLAPYKQSTMELTYWMNRLQSWIPKSIPVFVTLNPSRPPAKEKTYGSFTYHHPVYSLASLEAQRKVERIQGENNTYFAGAHLGFGFHEDGFTHALLVAQSITGKAPFEISRERYSAAAQPYSTVMRNIQQIFERLLPIALIAGFVYLSYVLNVFK